jgi:gmma-aminobutyric acid receptor subunit gamma/deltex-like protein
VVKAAQQCLFNLRRLKKFGLAPKTLVNFYRCGIESILLGCITAWQQRGSPEGGAVCPAHHRVHTACPPGHIQHTQGHRKVKKIIKALSHPSQGLFIPLPSRGRRQYRCIKAGTERLKNSFYLRAISLLNSHN